MTTDPKPSLEAAIVSSLASPDLRDALADVAEAGLDQLLDDGLLRDVPVLGTIIRLRSAAGVVRDNIFARKVARFLIRHMAIPAAERQTFLATLRTSQERRRLGETLLVLLDRLDDLQKPELLGRLFAGYVRGEIDYATFRRLGTALDRISLEAIPALRAFYDDTTPGRMVTGGEWLPELVAAGLVSISLETFLEGVGGSFSKNNLGPVFLRLVDTAA